MQFLVRSVAMAELPCRTRLPFRFGAATMTEAPLLHARVEVEHVGGRVAAGMAADLLVPRWFRKDLDQPPETDQEDLRQSVRQAAAAFCAAERRYARPFELWLAAFRDCCPDAPADGGELVRGFGVALVERALLDAVCRALRKNFWTLLRTDLVGFRAEAMQPDLNGFDLARELPDAAPDRIAVRHTVGMLDPLTAGEIAPEHRVRDGLPQALEEDLQAYGIRWLKIKVGAGPDRDVERLLALARLLRARLGELQCTLDGNEQYPDLGALASVLDRVAADPDGARLLQRLRYIEQPLPRAATLLPEAHRGLDAVTRHAPLIVDEADTGVDAFARALAIGYRGISVKNCKGVFRALLNFARCRRTPGAFLCGEDLTNLPVLPLQQDLATARLLGLEHVERNGHHYFPGLLHLPAAVQRAALQCHPDLYHDVPVPRLRIEGGQLACGSLVTPGYACDQELADVLTRELDWNVIAERA